MRISELRVLNIRVFDDEKIVYEGMCENTPAEYMNQEIRITKTGNPVEIEIIK